MYSDQRMQQCPTSFFKVSPIMFLIKCCSGRILLNKLRSKESVQYPWMLRAATIIACVYVAVLSAFVYTAHGKPLFWHYESASHLGGKNWAASVVEWAKDSWSSSMCLQPWQEIIILIERSLPHRKGCSLKFTCCVSFLKIISWSQYLIWFLVQVTPWRQHDPGS